MDRPQSPYLNSVRINTEEDIGLEEQRNCSTTLTGTNDLCHEPKISLTLFSFVQQELGAFRPIQCYSDCSIA